MSEHIESVFVTRYVASHADALPFFETFFGRGSVRAPRPDCREWDLAPGVIFQVIELNERAGEVGYALVTDDLDAQVTRLADAGITETDRFDVGQFEGLTFVAYADPEGVPTGLLNTGGRAEHPRDLA